MTLLGHRRRDAELLDAPVHDPDVLARSLDQVSDVNRRLGGLRALRAHLAPALAGRREVRVLDVGTGNGDVLPRLVAWGREEGARWWAVGVELHPQTAAVAAARTGVGEGVALVRGDGLRLPFADGAFDAVVSLLTLHHFDQETAVRLVSEMARVARVVVLVNDLERHALAYLGARALALTVWRGNPITRHDGPLSVLRSFTRAELLAVGRAAGLGRPRVRRHVPWRLVLEGEP